MNTYSTLAFFRGQIENEKIVMFSRKHWVVLLPEILLFLFLFTITCLVFIGFITFSPRNFIDPFRIAIEMLVLFLMIGIGIVIHHFFLDLIDYFLNVVIITNSRIVDIRKTIFLHDIKESIYFSEIQDVAFTQNGLIKNLFKFGELSITLGGEKETKTFTHMPNPDYHFRIINDLKNKAFPKRMAAL